MSVSHVLTFKVVPDGGTPIEKSVTVEAGAAPLVDEDVDASQTDHQINVALDVDQIQYIYIVATQDCTLETNSGAAPDDTINLEANVPVVYLRPASGSIPACPLSVDVTAIFITNTAALNIKIRALVDPTP
ncbi:MAG: hypothetical protein ABID40_03625 [Candidatus Bipolaricaulota bacterium]